MAKNQFPFDLSYQRKLVRLLFQDFDFLSVANSTLEPSNFESKGLAWVYKKIRDYYLDYGKRPTKGYIRNELKRDKKRNRIPSSAFKDAVKIYRSLEDDIADPEYLIDQVQQFVRHVTLKQALSDSVPHLIAENYEEIEKIFDQAVARKNLTMDVGVRYLTDYKERARRTFDELVTVPVGIYPIDVQLRGRGVGKKELALWLAAPNVGKSMGLIHVAKTAMLQGLNVVYFTLEMAADIVAERLDATLAGVKLSDEDADISHLFKRLEGMRRMYGTGIYIKEFPSKQSTVDDMISYAKHIEQREHFTPDLICVDYVDLIKPMKSSGGSGDLKRFEIGEIVDDLRGKMAYKFDCPVWSALQGNRTALQKEIVTMKDMSESFEPAKTADLILALCQTAEEKELSEMRIYFAKNRNEKSGSIVPIKNDMAYATLYDPPGIR